MVWACCALGSVYDTLCTTIDFGETFWAGCCGWCARFEQAGQHQCALRPMLLTALSIYECVLVGWIARTWAAFSTPRLRQPPYMQIVIHTYAHTRTA